MIDAIVNGFSIDGTVKRNIKQISRTVVYEGFIKFDFFTMFVEEETRLEIVDFQCFLKDWEARFMRAFGSGGGVDR